MDTELSSPDRRTALKALAAGSGHLGLASLATLGAGATSAIAASLTLDLSSESARLRAFTQMRGSLDDQLVIGYISGRYYGVVEEELTPLFGVSAATFARYRPAPQGGVEMVSFEQAYFTDLATGAYLKEWRNPYTGDTVSVPVSTMPPNKLLISPSLVFTLAKPMPGAKVEHLVLPVDVIDDDVFFVEQVRVAFPGPAAAKPFRYNEITTMRASLKDLSSPDLKRVPCAVTFSGLVGWRPWMMMGTRPGHLMAQGSGRYGVTLDKMPKAWLEATRKERPALLADPAKIMEAVWNS